MKGQKGASAEERGEERLNVGEKGCFQYLVLSRLLIYFDIYDFGTTLLNIWRDLDCKFSHFRICARSSHEAIQTTNMALSCIYSCKVDPKLLGFCAATTLKHNTNLSSWCQLQVSKLSQILLNEIPPCSFIFFKYTDSINVHILLYAYSKVGIF